MSPMGATDLTKKEDAGALVPIERLAVLARIGNKPGAAAKSISHGRAPTMCPPGPPNVMAP